MIGVILLIAIPLTIFLWIALDLTALLIIDLINLCRKVKHAMER